MWFVARNGTGRVFTFRERERERERERGKDAQGLPGKICPVSGPVESIKGGLMGMGLPVQGGPDVSLSWEHIPSPLVRIAPKPPYAVRGHGTLLIEFMGITSSTGYGHRV